LRSIQFKQVFSVRRRNVKPEDFDQFLGFIMTQAETLYGNWPLAA